MCTQGWDMARLERFIQATAKTIKVARYHCPLHAFVLHIQRFPKAISTASNRQPASKLLDRVNRYFPNLGTPASLMS